MNKVEKKKALQQLDLGAWQKGLVQAKAGFGLSDTDETRPPSRQESAAAILAALQDDDGVIDSLRSATSRAKFCYPVNYTLDDPWGILLPHDSNIKELAARLELRACAELATGKSDKAYDDVMLTLYLANSLTNEPLVISYLVRLRCIHSAVQPIWEGIAERRWSDSAASANRNAIAQIQLDRGTRKAVESRDGFHTPYH